MRRLPRTVGVYPLFTGQPAAGQRQLRPSQSVRLGAGSLGAACQFPMAGPSRPASGVAPGSRASDPEPPQAASQARRRGPLAGCITVAAASPDSPASTGRSPPGRAVRQPECQWEIGSPRDTDHATVTPPPAPFCGGAPGASTVSGSRALRLQPEVPRGAVGSGHSGRLLTYFGTGNFESDGNEAPPRA